MKRNPARCGGYGALRGARVASCAVWTALVPAAAGAVDGVWHVGPVPDVRAICHAGDSLYVGTGAGLFIVDIRDPSRVARIEAGPVLPSNSVRAIAARGDSVFVGTDAGLLLLRGGRATVYGPGAAGARGAAPVERVQAIAFGARGEILVATRGRGVGVLTRAGGYAITRRDSLLDDDVFDVLERPGRPRLIATAAGLCAQVDDTTFVSFQAGAGIPRGSVRQVTGDERAAYLRVMRRGVFRFDGMKASLLDSPAGIPIGDAASISAGADGALWAAGAGWLAVRRNGGWKRADAGDDEARPWRVIAADGAGAFAGSADGVVLALGRGTPLRVLLAEGLSVPLVRSIVPDGRGAAWFVSGGRVWKADAAAGRVSVEDSPPGAQAVGISPAGEVLAAGRWTVSRRGEQGWEDLRPSVLEIDPSFTAVSADRNGVVWVGARSGALYRFDGETWVRYAQLRSGVSAVREVGAYRDDSWAIVAGIPAYDAAGTWETFTGWDSSAVVIDAARGPRSEWVVATAQRLLVYDQARRAWRETSAPEIVGRKPGARPWIAPDRVTAIAFDATGRLFLGTGDGVVWVGREGEGRISARDGLGGTSVVDLAADDRYLWVGFARDGMSAVPLEKLR